MKEDLLQFIWRSKMLSSQNLQTTGCEQIEIKHPGQLNTNQGPDFLFAQIKIKDLLWVGHVEIHYKASDWNTHNHQEDPQYKNTILHVVWECDTEVYGSGRQIACIELKNYIPKSVLDSYAQLMSNPQKLACQPFLNTINSCIKTCQIERMMYERMDEKTEKVKLELSEMQWNWDELLHKKIAFYLMAPVNSDAMNLLWQHLPYQKLVRLRQDTFQLTAVILGVSGLLKTLPDSDYTNSLHVEFEFQKIRLGLDPMMGFEWKSLRMRPAHFPLIRLIQWISFLSGRSQLWSDLLEARDLKSLYKLFALKPVSVLPVVKLINPNTSMTCVSWSKQTTDVLLINAVCPILFAYGAIYQNQVLIQRAVNMLEKIKPEHNHIIHMWKSFNFVFSHSGHSQGGIQLYQKYCVLKKCTSCSIGHEILMNPVRPETSNQLTP